MNKISLLVLCITSVCSVTSPIASEARSEYWNQRVSLFEKLPISQDDIVFVGNSITDGGEFAELLSDCRVKNRGINSDDIDGVISRIDNILRGKPQKIFLLVGINDISHNLSLTSLIQKYETLVNKICTSSPDTKLYIQSVMPINNDFGRYKNLEGKEKIVISFNASLKNLALTHRAEYIDLWESLALPDSGKLNPDYTNDGLHLTGDGYLAWMQQLKKYVIE